MSIACGGLKNETSQRESSRFRIHFEGYWMVLVALWGLVSASRGLLADEGTAATLSRDARSAADLTGAWQLLVDDSLIEEKSGVHRTYHAFRKDARNPVLVPDTPWEGKRAIVYGTVLPGTDGQGYRAWYHCGSGIAYAESADGIEWRKPALGIAEYQGASENNLLFPPETDDGILSVIHAPWEPDAERRFQLLSYTYGRHPPDDLISGYRAAFSEDGIHWHWSRPPMVLADPGDVGNFLWDAHRNCYIGYPKTFAPVRGYRRRCVGFTSTTEFSSWPPAELMLVPDEYDDRWVEGDRQHTDFYGLSAFPYESAYIGFLWIFRIQQNERIGPIFVELVSSRDGVRWIRQEAPRTPILPNGEAGSWDAGMVFTPNHPLVEGDQIKLFYGGAPDLHTGVGVSSVGVATLRKDGFASMDADEKGQITTRLMSGLSGPLRVNADAGNGSLRVEVLDAAGNVLPGYAADDCRALTSDEISHTVTWAQHRTLPTTSAPLRLRFHLQNAGLYSFHAGDNTALHDPQPEREVFLTFEGDADAAWQDTAADDGRQQIVPRGPLQVVTDASQASHGRGCLALQKKPGQPATLEILGTSDLGNTFSLAAMVRSPGRGIMRLFSNYRGTGDPATGELIFDVNPGSGVLSFTLNGRRTSSVQRFLRDGQPHHYAATYDHGLVRLFIDGEQVGAEQIPATTAHLFSDRSIIEFHRPADLPSAVGVCLSSSLRFGEDHDGRFVTFRDEAMASPDQQLVGWADDLLITTKALTAEQIAQLSGRRNN